MAARAVVGSGGPGRLGLKRVGRLARAATARVERLGRSCSGGAARTAQLTADGNGSPNDHTCLVRVKGIVKGRLSVLR